MCFQLCVRVEEGVDAIAEAIKISCEEIERFTTQ